MSQETWLEFNKEFRRKFDPSKTTQPTNYFEKASEYINNISI
jgi:hypothetical protein